ncbi:MAG: hypothetical protein ACRD3N_02480 [Terracidiphilus sp.]
MTERDYVESCGNVFADLGFPDADEMLAKANIESEQRDKSGKSASFPRPGKFAGWQSRPSKPESQVRD